MSKQRPIIKIELSKSDKIIETIGIVILILLWIYVIYNYYTLPDTINTHFNAQGKPDGKGDKSFIIVFPIFTTIMNIILTTINQYPENFNYMVEITEENALEQYTKATKMIRILKIIITCMFTYISWKVINNTGVNIFIIILMFLAIIINILYFSLKKSKK